MVSFSRPANDGSLAFQIHGPRRGPSAVYHFDTSSQQAPARIKTRVSSPFTPFTKGDNIARIYPNSIVVGVERLPRLQGKQPGESFSIRVLKLAKPALRLYVVDYFEFSKSLGGRLIDSSLLAHGNHCINNRGMYPRNSSLNVPIVIAVCLLQRFSQMT